MTHFDTATLPSGLRLHVARQGRPGGRTVLMLHGITDSWYSFSRVLPGLPPEWHVLVPDQRGHGDSDRPVCGYSMDDFARDALGLLETAGVAGPVTVAGHSMGSMVAQRIAALAPHRVERLVLIGSTHSGDLPPVRDFAQEIESMTDPMDPAYIREFQRSTLNRPVPGGFFERVIAESAKCPAWVWRAALTGVLNFRARPVSCPVDVVWGDRDGFFDWSAQQALLAVMPQARLHVMPGYGHSPNWEDPDCIGGLITERETAGCAAR